MKILVTGSTGLVGTHLVRALRDGGHVVVAIARSRGRKTEPSIDWDPEQGRLDGASLEGADAVVHLAGESIAAHRWSKKQKAAILDSRVRGTDLLARTLARLTRPPKVLVSASAVGYYGDRGDERLDETSRPGDDFLAGVCKAWEGATLPAREKGIRVVPVRFGMILSRDGGALPKLLTPFQLGAGGILGNGRQYMSWIAIDDVVGAVRHVLTTPGLEGPVNVTAPGSVTNREFTKALGRVLSRPTLLPLPAFAAPNLLGEMADGLLLASQRVVPARLLSTGYAFRNDDLEPALRHVLGGKPR